MKKVILAVAMFALSATAQAEELKGMKCVNYGYRESILQVDGSYLMMQDTFFRNEGIYDLLKAYEKHFNLPADSLNLHVGKILVPSSQLNCTTVGKLPLSCTSAAGSATLQLNTWGLGDTPDLQISDRLKLISLSLNGSLSAPGPISLSGDKPTSVRLNMYGVTLTAVVEFKGLQYTIEMETFFHNEPGVPGQSFSYCE